MAYSILFKQCGGDHMTRGRSRAIDRIVVHFTATLASARNNATYFSRNEGQGASAHYFVDDITPEIYQSVAEGDTAWHAGDWQMNCRAIGIEVVSAGEDFSDVEVDKLSWLVQRLMDKYGIGAAGVIRHYDVTGKRCPAPYVAASKWAALKAAITGGVVSGGTTPAAPDGTVAELARRSVRATTRCRPGSTRSWAPAAPTAGRAGPTSTLWRGRSYEASTATARSADRAWGRCTTRCRRA